MGFLDGLHNGIEFFFLSHINSIVIVDTGHRSVGGDLNNVHAVNVTELFFLREGSTGHTGFLVVFVKEVLEGNSGKCLALSSHLHMLFRFNRLVKTV